jgi:hypothetical protein
MRLLEAAKLKTNDNYDTAHKDAADLPGMSTIEI